MPKAKFTPTEKEDLIVAVRKYTESTQPKTASEIADLINDTRMIGDIVTGSTVNQIRNREKMVVAKNIRKGKYSEAKEEFDPADIDIPKAKNTFRALINKIAECGDIAKQLRDELKGKIDQSFFC